MAELKKVALGSDDVSLKALNYLKAAHIDFTLQQIERLVNSKQTKIVQKSLSLLKNMNAPKVASIVKYCLAKFTAKEFPPQAYLELFELAEKHQLTTEIQHHRNQQKGSDLYKDFLECLEGGDHQKGQQLFSAHPTAQCMRCHKVNKKGGDAGPDLSIIGKQTPQYILESIVDPNNAIAAGYGIISATLKSGETVSGTFMSETKEYLSIKVGDKTRKLHNTEIASRQKAISSMPPMNYLLKKHEIRDILAYLRTLKIHKKRRSKGHWWVFISKPYGSIKTTVEIEMCEI